jgi:hypothetical protein
VRIEQYNLAAIGVTDHCTKQNTSTLETSQQKETELPVTKSP